MENKTVYIIGAGASKAANLPIQNELLNDLFSLTSPKITASSFLSIPTETTDEYINKLYPEFDKARLNITNFIVNSFGTSDITDKFEIILNNLIIEDNPSLEMINQNYQMLQPIYKWIIEANINIEDLFTLFDNLNASNSNFKSYSKENCNAIHNDLKFCIIYTLTYYIQKYSNTNSYNNFSKYLINLKSNTPQSQEPFSIISLNWDNLFETELLKECTIHNNSTSKKEEQIFIDYCFYNYPFNDQVLHIPSTHIKALGYKNIKFFNLHGSINWLECPICGRIFIDRYKAIALDERIQTQCPYCQKLSNNSYNSILRNLFITPTFLKYLGNTHIKSIWHNASLELSKADKVVFIGYSFPNADFEMRCLLKKSLRKDTKIEVVLHESDNPNYYNDILKNSLSHDKCDRIISKLDIPKNRYDSFFGKNNITYDYSGFDNHVEKLIGGY